MKSQQITPTKNKHFSSTNADVQMINEIKRNPTAYKKYVIRLDKKKFNC